MSLRFVSLMMSIVALLQLLYALKIIFILYFNNKLLSIKLKYIL